MTSAQSAISAVTFFHGTDFTPSFFFFFNEKIIKKQQALKNKLKKNNMAKEIKIHIYTNVPLFSQMFLDFAHA